jgi:hypothetical protein
MSNLGVLELNKIIGEKSSSEDRSVNARGFFDAAFNITELNVGPEFQRPAANDDLNMTVTQNLTPTTSM